MKHFPKNSLEERMMWDFFYAIPNSEETDIGVIEDMPLKKYIEMNGVTVLELNMRVGKLYYVSDNIEIYGINKEEYMKEGVRHFNNFIVPSQSNHLLVIAGLFQTVFTTYTPLELKNMKITVVGLRLIDKQQNTKATINRTRFTAWDNDSLPIKSVSLIQDITYLLKDNHYWIRISNSHNPSHVIFHHSNPDLKFTDDILTKREKEILKWIMMDKNVVDIAEGLSISPNTVNVHRQNILDKFCVKDTTALITLSNLTGYHLSDEINPKYKMNA